MDLPSPSARAAWSLALAVFGACATPPRSPAPTTTPDVIEAPPPAIAPSPATEPVAPPSVRLHGVPVQDTTSLVDAIEGFAARIDASADATDAWVRSDDAGLVLDLAVKLGDATYTLEARARRERESWSIASEPSTPAIAAQRLAHQFVRAGVVRIDGDQQAALIALADELSACVVDERADAGVWSCFAVPGRPAATGIGAEVVHAETSRRAWAVRFVLHDGSADLEAHELRIARRAELVGVHRIVGRYTAEASPSAYPPAWTVRPPRRRHVWPRTSARFASTASRGSELLEHVPASLVARTWVRGDTTLLALALTPEWDERRVGALCLRDAEGLRCRPSDHGAMPLSVTPTEGGLWVMTESRDEGGHGSSSLAAVRLDGRDPAHLAGASIRVGRSLEDGEYDEALHSYLSYVETESHPVRVLGPDCIEVGTRDAWTGTFQHQRDRWRDVAPLDRAVGHDGPADAREGFYRYRGGELVREPSCSP